MVRGDSHSFGVTQQDIARSLSISRSTVAQALNPNHEKNLPPETVALVKRKAAEMNYYPKRFAQLLREGKTDTIGAVFKLTRHYAPHDQIRLMSDTVLGRGYRLMAIDLGWFEGRPQAEDRFILESALDGLMLCDLSIGQSPRWMDVLQARQFPLVNVCSNLPCQMDCARWDVASAYVELTRHHLEQGSRRLALLLPARLRECHAPGGATFRMTGFSSCNNFIRYVLE